MSAERRGEPEVRLSSILKTYPGVQALRGVDLDLYPGEVHAIVGENGAGKSTLVKILAGMETPTDGEIVVDGRPVHLRSPRAALAAGIRMVPQDTQGVPLLSVGRNILLGHGPAVVRNSRLSASERREVTEAMTAVGLRHVHPATPYGALSVAQARLAQIAGALARPARVVILDEPTAVLSDEDSQHLLEVLDELRRAGRSVVYISHHLHEVVRIADVITVLRDGEVVARHRRGEVDRETLLAEMARVGGSAQPAEPVRHDDVVDDGAITLSVSDLSGDDFAGVCFEVRAGSVVGLAGVQGSGHGSVLRAMAGLTPVDAGQVSVAGATVATGSPRRSYVAGLRLVPEDRRGEGVVGGRTIVENVVLADGVRTGRGFLRAPAAERAIAQEVIDVFGVHPRRMMARVGNLSGGNQQKVVLGRVVASNPRVLMLAEPTQGIDVRAKTEILTLIRTMARERRLAVVIASSEFEELLEYCDEIHVLRLGRQSAHFRRGDATYHEVLEAATP
ncbi:ATP-binding cassette domain-containing protein [Nocardioides soli]|uniref:ABC-type sugar transport system ATPase subunit n=1 Tax=Nocardioides soli TaxID=1036020 RepID=A0A7W4VZ23_9ACTN|nr:ABC-type sugar transport system ATPase subunit [Nocardioides soli]